MQVNTQTASHIHIPKEPKQDDKPSVFSSIRQCAPYAITAAVTAIETIPLAYIFAIAGLPRDSHHKVPFAEVVAIKVSTIAVGILLPMCTFLSTNACFNPSSSDNYSQVQKLKSIAKYSLYPLAAIGSLYAVASYPLHSAAAAVGILSLTALNTLFVYNKIIKVQKKMLQHYKEIVINQKKTN